MKVEQARREAREHRHATGHEVAMLATLFESEGVWECTECDSGSEVNEAAGRAQ